CARDVGFYYSGSFYPTPNSLDVW
nr:immunoglobulin heavy chain junction region [Macaca mulatta]MOW23354.1 immunoglobulin heavy chain junction region [Macaca mulatta]MOW23362.1 immunoglobulin heavy chain junction region [Macaca mulatta]MOW23417.1 immunoglobulin heavy chain junction region [Macaca mulatta]MOW23461.1 immunoglobulin heavy chain junction region [Macaca mulatta]